MSWIVGRTMRVGYGIWLSPRSRSWSPIVDRTTTWIVLGLIRSRRVGWKVGPTRGLGKLVGLIAVKSPSANEWESQSDWLQIVGRIRSWIVGRTTRGPEIIVEQWIFKLSQYWIGPTMLWNETKIGMAQQFGEWTKSGAPKSKGRTATDYEKLVG